MRHLGSMFQSKLGDDKKKEKKGIQQTNIITFDKDFEKNKEEKEIFKLEQVMEQKIEFLLLKYYILTLPSCR
jgi:hypothetical protein